MPGRDFFALYLEMNNGNIYIVLEDGMVVLKEDGAQLQAPYSSKNYAKTGLRSK